MDVRRRVAQTVVGACAATLVVGCAGGARKRDDIRIAAERTAQQGTARFHVDAKLVTEELPKPLRVKVDGVTDLRRPLGVARLDLRGPLKDAGVPRAAQPETSKVTIRFDGARTHIRLPRWRDVLDQEFRGRRWIAVDLQKVMSALGLDQLAGEVLAGSIRVDPVFRIGSLASFGFLKKDRSATVEGAATTLYRADYTVQELRNAISAGEREKVDDALDDLDVNVSGRLKVDLWVDGQLRVRRLRTRSPVEITPGRPPGRLTLTTTYSDFGVPVSVPDPPDADTYDVGTNELRSFFAE